MNKAFIFFAAMILILPGLSHADSITLSGTSGDLGAVVSFANVGGQLQVTLANTSSADVLVPANVLTGVFWNWDYSGTLVPVSASIDTGVDSVYYGANPAGGNVGGEWAYASGLNGAPGGAANGISSSGVGLFGAANFHGNDLTPPSNSVAGLQWGITSKGDIEATGNTGVTKAPLIYYSAVFLFNGIPVDFDPSNANFRNVSFQYGTSLSEPNVPVPEQGTLLLLGSGLMGVGVLGRKKFRN